MPPATRGKRPRRSTAPPLRVLWITPLRALAADTEEALRQPLVDLGIPWTLESRTGDTSAAMRARQARRLPTALVTTPESLSLMLSRDNAREMFADLRAVVVDEWHELMGTKRGVLVELALARLRYYQPRVRTWGLSATIGNLHDALDALLGVGGAARRGRIVRGVEPKEVVIDALIPPVVERFPWAGHLGTQMLPQVIEAIDEGRQCDRLHEHAIANRDLVSGDSRRATGLGRRHRASSRVARPRSARMGRGRAARRTSALRRRDVVPRPGRRFLAGRPRATDRQPERRRAIAAARRSQRTSAGRGQPSDLRADERARADRGCGGARRSGAGRDRVASSGRSSARRPRATRRHRRAGRRVRGGTAAARGANDASVRRACETTSGAG